MRLKQILVFMAVIVVTSIFPCVYADSDNEMLSKLLKNMRSMKADFVQTIVDKNNKAIQKSTGHMSLQRPNQFRWEIEKPNRQLIVTNGKRLWVYDPDLDQVTIRSLVKAAGETPAMLLSDANLSLGKEFNVTMVPLHSETVQWFTLVPTDKSAVISSLKLGFTNKVIRRMQLHDHLGHTTLIEFSHVVLNSPLSTSAFNFKPPSNVDVVDETKH